MQRDWTLCAAVHIGFLESIKLIEHSPFPAAVPPDPASILFWFAKNVVRRSPILTGRSGVLPILTARLPPLWPPSGLIELSQLCTIFPPPPLLHAQRTQLYPPSYYPHQSLSLPLQCKEFISSFPLLATMGGAFVSLPAPGIHPEYRQQGYFFSSLLKVSMKSPEE